MDLERVRRVAAVYSKLEGEDKAHTSAQAAQVRGFMTQSFPALAETDQAAVAWYIAEMLYAIRSCDLEHISDTLTNSAAAYSVVTTQLLGWTE